MAWKVLINGLWHYSVKSWGLFSLSGLSYSYRAKGLERVYS